MNSLHWLQDNAANDDPNVYSLHTALWPSERLIDIKQIFDIKQFAMSFCKFSVCLFYAHLQTAAIDLFINQFD